MSNQRSKNESREYKGSGTGCLFQAIGTVLLSIGGGVEFFAIQNNLNMEIYADSVHTGALAFAIPGLISFVGGIIQNRSEKPDIEKAAMRKLRRNKDLKNFKVDENTPKNAPNVSSNKLTKTERRARRQENRYTGGYKMTSLGEEKYKPMSRNEQKMERKAVQEEIRNGKKDGSTRGVTIVNQDNWEDKVARNDRRNKKFMEQVDHALNSPNLAGKIGKVETEDNKVRIKYGKVRIFGVRRGSEIEITKIDNRNERTYKK